MEPLNEARFFHLLYSTSCLAPFVTVNLLRTRLTTKRCDSIKHTQCCTPQMRARLSMARASALFMYRSKRGRFRGLYWEPPGDGQGRRTGIARDADDHLPLYGTAPFLPPFLSKLRSVSRVHLELYNASRGWFRKVPFLIIAPKCMPKYRIGGPAVGLRLSQKSWRCF